MPEVKIKKLETHSEYETCVAIQKEVWKHDDIDINPEHHFCIAVKTGAILLGAFVENELVGFVFSFPAVIEGHVAQHSHLLAVLPEYRGLKIGKQLKWAQRDSAVQLSYDLITWTVDPLQAKNANLNIRTLGATTNCYLPNFYGEISTLSLMEGMPTDRLFMEWHIKNESIVLRREKKYHTVVTETLPRALQGEKSADGSYSPFSIDLSLDDERIFIEIPQDLNSLISSQPNILLKWQSSLREVMMHYFSKGYRVVDFHYGDRCFYVLRNEKSER